MTKEELREGISAIIINKLIHEMWTEPAPEEYQNAEDDYIVHHVGFATESLNITIIELLQYLHDNDVVVKVEGWLPTRSGMVCTVEPLVKENDETNV